MAGLELGEETDETSLVDEVAVWQSDSCGDCSMATRDGGIGVGSAAGPDCAAGSGAGSARLDRNDDAFNGRAAGRQSQPVQLRRSFWLLREDLCDRYPPRSRSGPIEPRPGRPPVPSGREQRTGDRAEDRWTVSVLCAGRDLFPPRARDAV